MRTILEFINKGHIKETDNLDIVNNPITYKGATISIRNYDDMPKYMVSLKKEWNNLPADTKSECINLCKQIIDNFVANNQSVHYIDFIGYRNTSGCSFSINYDGIPTNIYNQRYFAIIVNNYKVKLMYAIRSTKYIEIKTVDELRKIMH